MNRYLFLLILIMLWGCTEKKPAPQQVIAQPPKAAWQEFVAADHLQTIGDFDGDGRKDTVRSHLKFLDTFQELDSVPKFDETVSYDSVAKFYSNVEAYLLLSSHPADTLFIGRGFGPFCLFNIGDTAIVYCEDFPDFSMVNEFEIQYYRKGKWKGLTHVEIRESAFYTSDSTKLGKPLNDIPDYLEKHNGNWVYRDFWSRDSSDAWYPLKQLLNPPKHPKKK